MANPLILPAAAMLALIGAGVGVHLGNAAIAEINPAYYDVEQPRARFYADMTPNLGGRNWEEVHRAELRATRAGLPTQSTCVGCRTYPEEYYPVHEASLGKPQTGWAEIDETPAVEMEAEVEASAADPDPQVILVHRYTHFPVTSEEAEALAMADTSLAGGGEEITAD